MRSPKSAAGFENDFAGASSRSRPCAPLTLRGGARHSHFVALHAYSTGKGSV